MGYIVDYTDTSDDRVPCLDAIEYMGFRRGLLLARAARQPDMTDDVFYLIAAFAGVRGRPVFCLWRRWRPSHDDAADCNGLAGVGVTNARL